MQKCNLFQVLAHSRKRYTKKSKFTFFSGSSLTPLALQAAGSGAGVVGDRAPHFVSTWFGRPENMDLHAENNFVLKKIK